MRQAIKTPKTRPSKGYSQGCPAMVPEKFSVTNKRLGEFQGSGVGRINFGKSFKKPATCQMDKTPQKALAD